VSDPYKSRQYQRNRRLVLDAAEGRCYWPGCRRLATTADHIVPLARGGDHSAGNLRPCCWHHNSQGGAQITNQIKQNRRMGLRSRRW
jgi:5-methylcytosine-specific restriction endonuclease McrA